MSKKSPLGSPKFKPLKIEKGSCKILALPLPLRESMSLLLEQSKEERASMKLFRQARLLRGQVPSEAEAAEKAMLP